MKPARLLLDDMERFGWSEPEPAMTERGRRRSLVNTFLVGRSYWNLLHWLAARMPSHRRFLSLDEALELARLDYALEPSEAKKAVVVVARYFAAARWHWLEGV